ncbi:MAG: guanylate kinase [Bacteroidetes bacterium]|nr:guanylate kinase [Bacteroidota bacterium]
MSSGQLLILSAPSGAGKTTLVRRLMAKLPGLAFSISATTRPPRGSEEHEVDYHFLTAEDFRARAERGEFLEWEEVYPGRYYGTLRSEVERLWAEGKVVAFDIDVVGGRNLKQQFGDRALALFVAPPSLEVLGQRLRGRGTETEDQIAQRLAKAEWELAQASEFDRVVVNDDLDRAEAEALAAILAFAPSCA